MSAVTETIDGHATNMKGSTMTSAIGSTLASTKAELLRLRKWPAVWVTIGAWLAMTAMFGYLFNYVSYTTGRRASPTRGPARRACSPRSSRRTSTTCCCRACRCSAAP